VLDRPHSITASVEVPEGGGDGVLLRRGSTAGRYSFFLEDGALHSVHDYVGRSLHRASSPGAVPAGARELRLESEPTGEADPAAGRGIPGAGSSTSTGPSSPTRTRP
jgi:arylsulfatase